ncbi:MAG: T9SS type A sorting domain-containing protein, partial [Flavobacteriales bacterium]|nr:T9SS type A sorting domain-containing protein [Flavobacteriales bacterium]
GTYNIFLTVTDEESQCSDQSTAQIVVEDEDDVTETPFELVMFPNPASDVLQVSCATAAEMVIRDAAGREVWRERMAAGRRLLDVTSWAQGVYTMEVNPESVQLATQTARFAIQH